VLVEELPPHRESARGGLRGRVSELFGGLLPAEPLTPFFCARVRPGISTCWLA